MYNECYIFGVSTEIIAHQGEGQDMTVQVRITVQGTLLCVHVVILNMTLLAKQ